MIREHAFIIGNILAMFVCLLFMFMCLSCFVMIPIERLPYGLGFILFTGLFTYYSIELSKWREI